MVNSCYEVFLDGEHECHNWHDAFGFAKNERGCTGFHSYGETSHRGKKMKELRDYPIV
jgi:nitrate reductase assembly molybdenum cofactor insertion protein NarJ